MIININKYVKSLIGKKLINLEFHDKEDIPVGAVIKNCYMSRDADGDPIIRFEFDGDIESTFAYDNENIEVE